MFVVLMGRGGRVGGGDRVPARGERYCREDLCYVSLSTPGPVQPSWNPAVDAQAVDRTHRVGQHKPVVTYRLLSCGSIEEQVGRGARASFLAGLVASCSFRPPPPPPEHPSRCIGARYSRCGRLKPTRS